MKQEKELAKQVSAIFEVNGTEVSSNTYAFFSGLKESSFSYDILERRILNEIERLENE